MLKNIFSNLDLSMVKFSAYEIKEISNSKYIAPKKGATALHFRVGLDFEKMLVDTLNLGKSLYEKVENANDLCLTFTNKYGLLGIYQPSNQREKSPKKDVSEIVFKKHYSNEYGEEIDSFKAEIIEIYLHYLLSKGSLPAEQEQIEDDFRLKYDSTPIVSGLKYILTPSNPPQMEWVIEELIDVLRIAYAMAATDEKEPLKQCKNCGEIYYNKHQKSEFCSVKCRNYFNVKVFRSK